MAYICDLATIDVYYRVLGLPAPEAKAWALLDLAQVKHLRHQLKRFWFYGIYLKTQDYGPLSYGRTQYDYQAGSLVFVAPGQVVGIDDGKVTENPEGLALLFTPELSYTLQLKSLLKNYSFFAYSSNEALHLAPAELTTIVRLMHQCSAARTQAAARAGLKQLLERCRRYYLRQFSSRHALNCDTLARFEALMSDYFHSDKPTTQGLPTVAWCAEQLHFSPNYLGDMIKKETGRSALSYIHHFIVDYIKQRLSDPAPTISSIAWEMGFAQPHHLSRLFKKETGLSPQAYRAQFRHR